MSQNNSTQNHGIVGALHTTLPVAMSISAFTAISWYNVLELNIIIWLTFKKRRGLYFYSLLVASWGIVFHQLGYIMRFFEVWKNNYVSEVVINIGWYCMVTGQSLVLFSRLHLVVRDHMKIRWVLYMIIIDFFIFHIPTSTLDFFCVYDAAKHIPAFNIMEKIQVTGFFLQEAIISGLYIYETRKLLRPAASFQKGQIRRVMRHLIYINIFIILLDAVILVTEYAGLFDIQVTFKGAVYSVKLRVEFAILNELVKHAGGQTQNSQKNSNNVYWQSGSREEPSRARDREIALDAIDAKGNHSAGNNADEGRLGYSFSAGRGKSSPFAHQPTDRDKGHVVKTTEVVIDSSSPGVTQIQRPHRGDEFDGRRFDEEGRMGNYKHRAMDKNRKSPASSEVEFAGQGF